MAEATTGLDLGAAAALLAAGVLAVPVFKRIGLGSVLGYLAAGLAIGPFGLKLFREPETILHVAEFGVEVEVADDGPERSRGLMFRDTLDPAAGMLFALPSRPG